jgi:hypothetical protein
VNCCTISLKLGGAIKGVDKLFFVNDDGVRDIEGKKPAMHLLPPRIFSLLHVCVQARVTEGRALTRPKALAFASLKAKQTKELIPKIGMRGF